MGTRFDSKSSREEGLAASERDPHERRYAIFRAEGSEQAELLFRSSRHFGQ